MAEHTETFEERGQLWTRWNGGCDAPKDWNGGRVLLACGEILHPYQQDVPFDWYHDVSETGCIEPGCIVGYTSIAHPPSPFASIPDPAAFVEAARGLFADAQAYFNGYVQDEAADLDCCIGEGQHEKAKRFAAALAAFRAAMGEGQSDA